MALLSPPPVRAGKSLTAEEGTFTDGSAASSSYSPGQDICWKVAPSCPEEGRVSLHFTRVDVEQGCDRVQVFDADGKLLSKSATTSTTYSSAAFTVWFHSDESGEETGFTAHYSCDTLSEEEGVPDELDK